MIKWPFKRSTPEQQFWSWFVSNRERLHGLTPEDPALMNEVGNRLRQVHKDLIFEFGMSDGRAVEFVVSADGNASVFPAVLQLVSAAPAISGWKITPFRQPGKTDVVIEMRGQKLNARDLWFNTEPDGTKVALTILIPGLTPETEEPLSHMGFLLLDNALGEFLVETSVGGIRFLPLRESPPPPGFLPFSEIHHHVKQLAH